MAKSMPPNYFRKRVGRAAAGKEARKMGREKRGSAATLNMKRGQFRKKGITN